MTTYEQIKKFREELIKAQYKIDDLEEKKEELEDEIECLEFELSINKNNIKIAEENLTESDPDYRRYWAEKLTYERKENLRGQFVFKGQYAVCNGYVFAVFNEPIEGMPFCDGVSIDLFELTEKSLSVKTSEIETQDSKYLEIGDAEIERDFYVAVKKFLCLNDTASYSNILTDGHSSVIVKCKNKEKALILGRRKN